MLSSENDKALQDYMMFQDSNPHNSKGGVPLSWILLDIQSTIDVFCNKKLLKDIHDIKTSLCIH